MVSKNKKTNRLKRKINIFIIFGILLTLLLGIYYISNSEQFKSLRGQQDETESPQISLPAENEASQEAIDCSQKVAQDNKLLASDQKSDCLFIGCGDFFQ